MLYAVNLAYSIHENVLYILCEVFVFLFGFQIKFSDFSDLAAIAQLDNVYCRLARKNELGSATLLHKLGFYLRVVMLVQLD